MDGRSNVEDALIVREQRDRVCRITLNRPGKLNAFTPAMEEQFFQCIDDAMRDAQTRVVVISGAGRAFSSGADTSSAGSSAASIRDAANDMTHSRGRVDRWLRLWSAPKPIIAQAHGYCLGTANELVACCDLVVCGESARFGMPEVRRFALPPTLAFWPLRIGLQRTKELLFTGRLIDGAEAVGLGMAIAVVPDAELTEHVDRLAAQIAEVDPRLLAVVKQAANTWFETVGLRGAALRGAEYHAIYHQASEWGKTGRE
jgi:enoyl-CoA hydratase